MPPLTGADGSVSLRTRARVALLQAARELLAENGDKVSVREITRRAGVGVAQFLQHFPGGREGLFQEAVLEILDAYAAWLRAETADLTDPAEIFAHGFRLTGRVALADRSLLRPLLTQGTEVLFIERGLREIAFMDLEVGIAQGRFADLDPDVVLMSVGGMLLGLLHLLSEHPSRVTDATIDDLAAAALRMLGVDAAQAAHIVSRELPTAPRVHRLVVSAVTA